MPQEYSDKKTKQAYEKPELKIIELMADEVLAAGCKVVSGIRGPGKPKQSCSSPGGQCYGSGS